MRYILQLNTGSFGKTVWNTEDIISTLKRCLHLLDVEKVIFGWAPDNELNKRICGFLEEYPVETYFWLPVFAEIQDFNKTRVNHSITAGRGAKFNSYEGDAFEFACQSDPAALERAVEIFDELTRGCSVDGVFLDRIRYASAATSPGAVYGCWCSQCQNRYKEKGIRTERLLRFAREKNMDVFLPAEKRGSVYRYEDRDIDLLMGVKRELIAEQIARLSRIFRERGMKVGIDTFAPPIADFVGQDLELLGECADFVKPMIYLRTNAPAGLPFELNGMGEGFRECLNELWGEAADTISGAARQMGELIKKGITVTPGVDANEVEGICAADTEYVQRYLRALEEAGCGCAVLSWDVMRLSDELVRTLAKK